MGERLFKQILCTTSVRQSVPLCTVIASVYFSIVTLNMDDIITFPILLSSFYFLFPMSCFLFFLCSPENHAQLHSQPRPCCQISFSLWLTTHIYRLLISHISFVCIGLWLYPRCFIQPFHYILQCYYYYCFKYLVILFLFNA